MNSVHFYGTVVAEDSGSRAKLQIVFAKPHLSWMEIKTDDLVEVVVANKIEGFVSRTQRDSGKSKVDILRLKRLRALTIWPGKASIFLPRPERALVRPAMMVL